MRNISANYFKFGTLMHQEMLFKDISHLAAEEMLFKYISHLKLWQPLCSAEQTPLCNFGKVHHKEQFCGTISNLD